MLPKKQRIRRKDFALLKREGQVFKNSLFLLRSLEVQRESQFGVSVSKKVVKGAVDRNKLRRLGYRIIKENLPMVKSGVTAYFSFLRKPKDVAEAAAELKSILRKSKLLK